MSTKYLPEKNDFWQNDRASVLEYGIPKDKAEWFVRWAKNFAKAQKSVPLKARRQKQVKAFLSALESQTNLEVWQVGRPSKKCGIRPCNTRLVFDYMSMTQNSACLQELDRAANLPWDE